MTSELGRKSVLSRAGSQYSGRGKSPAAPTRIPLGPKAAQYYVTNSRRRRRANELILNTLEARRRLERQSALGGSLWGSESYLLGCDPAQLYAGDAQPNGRLSLSPSPVQLAAFGQAATNSNASPIPPVAQSNAPINRSALSDLGGTASAAAQAQRQRLLRASSQATGATQTQRHKSLPKKSKSQNTGSSKRPPLAKLDQNSSDLCSSNGSSSSSDESDDNISDASSGTNFTELVTRELVPECVRLETGVYGTNEGAVNEQLARVARQYSDSKQARKATSDPTTKKKPNAISRALTALPTAVVGPLPRTVRASATDTTSEPTDAPPKVPERSRARNKSPTTRRTKSPTRSNKYQQQKQPQQEHEQQVSASKRSSSSLTKAQTASNNKQTSNAADSELENSRLRRGALRRDSIRRMRLNRVGSAGATGANSVDERRTRSSESESESQEISMIQDQRTDGSPPQQQRSHSSATVHSTTSIATTRSSSIKAQALPESRRQRIENNPFLNRHHFRRTESVPRPPSSIASESLGRKAPTPPARTGSIAPGANRYSLQDSYPPTPSHRAQSRTRETGRRAAAEDADQIDEVERMLRRMRPGQSISSKSTENTEKTGAITSRRRDVITTATMRSDDEPRDESPPPRRFVEEQLRSRDEASFDLARGARQHFLESDRWRLERSEPVVTRSTSSRGDGFKKEIKSEEKLFRERTQVIESTSISPPAGFADCDNYESKRDDRSKYNGDIDADKRHRYELRPTSASRSQQLHRDSSTDKQISAAKQQVGSAPVRPPVKPPKPPMQVERRVEVVSRDAIDAAPKRSGRSTLAEQLRLRPVPQQPSDEPQQRPSVSARSRPMQRTRAPEPPEEIPAARMLDSHRIIQSSLPKFERTADDEFKKRVDQLRQMARANLSSSSSALGGSTIRTTGNGMSRSNDARRSLSNTRPLSTNWSPNDPLKRPTAESSLGLSTGSQQQPTRASLTEALRADGYIVDPLGGGQRGAAKLPVGAWRRSNSSLASIGRSTGGSSVIMRPSTSSCLSSSDNPRRPLSPPASRATPPPISGNQPASSHLHHPVSRPTATATYSGSSSVVFGSDLAGPRPTSPMRLLVREKNAPKLDYALVQPSSDLPDTSPPASKKQPLQTRQQVLVGQRSAPPKAAPLKRAASPRPSETTMTQKSPTSNNDDSAIASSVSSPSLSFMTASQSATRAPQPMQSSAATGDSSNGSAPSGILQSILRRNQRFAQSYSSGGDSSGDQSGDTGVDETGESSAYLRRETSSPPLLQRQSSAAVSQSTETVPKSSSSVEQQIGQQSKSSSNALPRQQQQVAFNGASAASISAIQQQQQQQQPAAKRVHFNDRTSVRSFESISSLASTTVPNDNLRQQIGSPDSMGSGSTSRLSADSPVDAMGHHRCNANATSSVMATDASGLRSGASGAAIYAVRDDLDYETAPQQQTYLQQLQQMPSYAPYPNNNPLRPAAIAAQQQQSNELAMASNMRQQQQQQQPCIRMTAPPAINTRPLGAFAAPAQQVPAGAYASQQLVHDAGGAAAPVAPPRQVHLMHQTAPSRAPATLHESDSEDAHYALQLRRAAAQATRAMQYVGGNAYAPQQMVQQPQQVVHAPAPQVVHVSPQMPPQQRVQLAPQISPAMQQSLARPTVQQQPGARRNGSSDLLNFQTEV